MIIEYQHVTSIEENDVNANAPPFIGTCSTKHITFWIDPYDVTAAGFRRMLP